ncbi:50S ribosomal protein L34e [Candidatus Micrarchaeota archaeon RBG_16_49_10]|nr:MAG: 50S ribosomal protein L34e [Candidatus Micrarchaeota archaeon RBG_16_49_10]
MRRSLRSNSIRKMKTKIPGNRVVVHFSRKKPSIAKCGSCGKPLNGVPRLRPSRLKKLSKTEKRPERPYGGSLCPECSRKIFRMKAVST